MKDSKQEIIFDLKNKLNEFKTKCKERKAQNSKEDDIENLEINMNTLKNYYKSQKNDNKNNKDNINKLNHVNQTITLSYKNGNINKDLNNIKLNNYHKENGKKELINQNVKANSSANCLVNKNYLDFNIDEIIKQRKKPKKEKSDFNFINPPTELNQTKHKTFVNLEDLKINLNKKQTFLMNYNKNISSKNFIKLNLSLKKGNSFISNNSNTDRNYRKMKNYNTDNLYEQNFSEPNSIKINKNNNYYKLKTKLSDFMDEIRLSDYNNKNIPKIRPNLIKPTIKDDISKYNLNFLTNNYNNEDNHFKKSYNKIYENNVYLKDIFDYNNDYNNKNEIIRYSSHRKTIPLYQESIAKNNKTKKTSNLLSNINNNLSNFNYSSNKNTSNNHESIKNNSFILNDIHILKNNIQNLSNEEINNLPFSVYKEIEDLYYLIYIKFFKNN